MSELTKKIVAEAHSPGAIPFSRFMELALYCPVYGYYEAEKDTLGRRGDYFTSVSTGPLFGQMLAFQFAAWREEQAGSQPPSLGPLLEIVEAGAHDGKLAADILLWLKDRRPEIYERTAYVVVEPSPARTRWQQPTLEPFSGRVRWVTSLSELGRPAASPSRPFRVVFANELLDAMPARRLGWNAQTQRWFEWGVTFREDRFHWVPLAAPKVELPIEILQPLLEVLPDGFILELCPTAEAWWEEAGHALGPGGKLLTFDYGLTWEELLIPERPTGTLRAYAGHRVTADLLARPGEQDVTAHVNFSAIQAAGERAGLRTEDFTTQARFLSRIAERIFRPDSRFGDWSGPQTRQFQTLTHPQHLGAAFRALVQSRPDSAVHAGDVSS